MGSTFTISNTISKEYEDEKTSFTVASIGDAARRENDAISNERIQKDDIILDTYKVISDPIFGGMGSVWCVHHMNWDTDLAMKRPQAKFFAEGGKKKKEQFIEECENWINLGLHPNIVSCYYVREIGGIPTIFSEWMDGGSLKDVIKSGVLYDGDKEETEKRLLDISIQTLRGIKYSHENGLVHQDIKPGNILLTKDFSAKLADFGLAKAQSDISEAEKSSGYTLAYCPKEQTLSGEPEKWMDIYAWALSVLEMYLGKRVWDKGSDASNMLKDCLKSTRISMPSGLEEIIEDCVSLCADDCSFDTEEIEQNLIEIYRKTTGNNYFRREAKAAEKNSGTLNNRALSFLDLGMDDAAKVDLDRAVELNSEDEVSVLNQLVYRWYHGELNRNELLILLRKALTDENELKEIESLLDKENGALSLVKTVGEADIVSETAVSPNGRYAVYKDLGSTGLNVIDIETGKVISNKFIKNRITVCFSADSEKIYAAYTDGNEAAVMIVGVKTGYTDSVINCPDYKNQTGGDIMLIPSSDNIHLFALYECGMKYVLCCIDISSEKVKYVKHFPFYKCVGCLSPDGTVFYLMNSVGESLFEINVINSDDGNLIKTIRLDSYDYPDPNVIDTSFVIDHGRQRCYIGTESGFISEWDLESESLVRIIGLCSEWIEALAMFEDKNILVAGDSGGKVYVLSTDGSFPILMSDIWDQWIRNIFVIGDGKFAVCADDKQFYIYKLLPFEKQLKMKLSRIVSEADMSESYDKFNILITDAEEAVKNRRINDALKLLYEAENCDYTDIGLVNGLYRMITPYCSLKRLKSTRRLKVYRSDSSGTHASGIRKILYDSEGKVFFCDYPITLKILDGKFEFDNNNFETYKKLVRSFDTNDYAFIEDNNICTAYWDSDDCIMEGKANIAYLADIREVNSLQKKDGYVLFTKNGDKNGLYCYTLKNDGIYDKSCISSGNRYGDVRISEKEYCYVREGEYINKYSLKDQSYILSIKCKDGYDFGNCFDVTKNGRFLAYERYKFAKRKEDRDHTVEVYDTQTASIIMSVRVGNYTRSISFVQRNLLFICDETGEVLLTDPLSEDPVIGRYTASTGDLCAEGAAVSDDMKYVCIVDQSHALTLWENTWEYSFDGFTDWDEKAERYLLEFVMLHPDYDSYTGDQKIKEYFDLNGVGYINGESLLNHYHEKLKENKKGFFGKLFKKKKK